MSAEELNKGTLPGWLRVMPNQTEKPRESNKSGNHSTEPSSLEDRIRALEAQLSNQAGILSSLNNIEGSLVAMAEATKQTNTEMQKVLVGINKPLAAMAEFANRNNAEAWNAAARIYNKDADENDNDHLLPLHDPSTNVSFNGLPKDLAELREMEDLELHDLILELGIERNPSVYDLDEDEKRDRILAFMRG